jgi:hypothetical protein
MLAASLLLGLATLAGPAIGQTGGSFGGGGGAGVTGGNGLQP